MVHIWVCRECTPYGCKLHCTQNQEPQYCPLTVLGFPKWEYRGEMTGGV